MKNEFSSWKKKLGITTDKQLSESTKIPLSTLMKWKYGFSQPSGANLDRIQVAIKRAESKKK